MNRRRFLTGLGAGGLGAVAGIRLLSDHVDQVHRLRGVNTPLRLVVHNSSAERRSVSLRVELGAEPVFDGSGAVNAGESAEVTAFRRAGRYSAAAGSDGMQAGFEDVPVTWEQLADCNSNSLVVSVGADQLSTRILHTNKGCNSVLFGQ